MEIKVRVGNQIQRFLDVSIATTECLLFNSETLYCVIVDIRLACKSGQVSGSLIRMQIETFYI